jgi:hypothetical protein
VGEELNIPRRSIDPRDTKILTTFSSIAFPLEHLIHPAAAAGEDGDGPLTTVSVNNGLWLQRQWALTVVFISDIVASAAVVWERRQRVGSLMGLWGRGVLKGDVSRSMAVAVEGGDGGGGGGGGRDFITIILNLGATVLF